MILSIFSVLMFFGFQGIFFNFLNKEILDYFYLLVLTVVLLQGLQKMISFGILILLFFFSQLAIFIFF